MKTSFKITQVPPKGHSKVKQIRFRILLSLLDERPKSVLTICKITGIPYHLVKNTLCNWINPYKHERLKGLKELRPGVFILKNSYLREVRTGLK